MVSDCITRPGCNGHHSMVSSSYGEIGVVLIISIQWQSDGWCWNDGSLLWWAHPAESRYMLKLWRKHPFCLWTSNFYDSGHPSCEYSILCSSQSWTAMLCEHQLQANWSLHKELPCPGIKECQAIPLYYIHTPYVPDNVWHSKPFSFRFSAHPLPLFDHWVKLSTPLSTLTWSLIIT